MSDQDGMTDSLFGVRAIAAYVGQPIRKTRYLIHIKAIPVTRAGERIIIGSKRAIDEALGRTPEVAADEEDAPARQRVRSSNRGSA
jgi:hypothetical protein